MVSRVRYNSFKGARGPRGERVPFIAIPLVVVVLIALAVWPPQVLLAATVLYALSGPTGWLLRRRRVAGEP
jgi:CDP-diacylglycerol--serine O-phosphatidyltransferase